MVSDTWFRYRHALSLFLDIVAASVKALVMAVDQKSHSLGDKMSLPAEQVITSSPLWRLHQFGNIEFEGAPSFCGSSGSLMVPYLDYREDGEEPVIPRCWRFELWCEECVCGLVLLCNSSFHFDCNLTFLQHTASLLPLRVPYNDHC